MNLTDLFNIPKPEDEDYANGALQLQVVAEQADAQISALQAAFTANLRTPAWIGQTTADLTGITTNSYATPFDPDANMLSDVSLTTLYANQILAGAGGGLLPSIQGSYMFGAFGNYVSTAPSSFTLRRQLIGVSLPTGPQFTTQSQFIFTDTCDEANTGAGMFLTTTGSFDYQFIPFNPPQRFWWGFAHTNSGTVTLKAGAIFWWAKFSDLAS